MVYLLGAMEVKMMAATKISVCLGLTVCFTVFTLAQVPFGSLVGRVLDSSGATVPQARVRATNLATNVETAGNTNAEGNYEFRELIPGRYRVEVQASGFKRFNQEPIELRVGQVLTLDVALELGSSIDSVTVTTEVPLLESSTASTGTVLDTQRVEELPRAGDSVIYLLQLSPGVIVTRPPTYWWTPNNLGTTGLISVGGATTGYNLMMLDGNPIQAGTSATMQPFPEMVQEVAVQTNTVDASNGRFTGLVANMVTRSGTNQFHGDVVYTTMNNAFIAKSYFTKQALNDPTTGPITPQKLARFWPTQDVSRFRWGAGGPVYIPHVYNGRNRTFWSYGMDFSKFLVNAPDFSTVPTAQERQGDFSALLAIGPGYQLYDPVTTSPAPNGRFQRVPFAGNIIPPSRINPIATKLLSYWKLPNTTGTIDGRNNYQDPEPDNEPVFQGIFRADHTVSENNRLFVSGTFLHQDATYFNPFNNIVAGSILHRRQKAIGLGDAIVLRPFLVLDLHYNVTRSTSQTPSPSLGFDVSSIGWPAGLLSQTDPRYTTLPQVCMTDFILSATYAGWCMGGGGLSYSPFTRHAMSAELAYTRGNHSLRFGFSSWITQNATLVYDQCKNPRLNFDSTWTGGPFDNSPAPTLGGGLAAYLLGLPSSGTIGVCPSSFRSNKYVAGFVEDAWKVNRKLTLNLGLRYEVDTGNTERYNRMVRGFDFTTPNPIQQTATANYALNPVPQLPLGSFRTLGGLTFAGVGGTPRNLWNTNWNHFSPRLGLAYLLRPRTVLRASYAILFQPLGADFIGVIQSGFASTTSLVPSVDNGQTFIATLSNPFPSGFAQPVGAAGGLQTFLGQNLTFVLPQLTEPYTQRWSFNIQQMLPGQILADVGYMGSRSVRLTVSEQLNNTFRQYLSTSPTRDQATINTLSQQVSNPFYGIPQFQGTALQSRTIALSQLLTPYPQFLGIGFNSNAGSAWYNALQARVQRRFGNGWTLQVSYAYSKFMQAITRLNPTDPTPEHVVSSQDRPQYLTVNGVYELPFGHGKPWLSSGAWSDKLFGGWSVVALYTAESGPPLSWGNIRFSGNIKDIALPSSERTPTKWFNTAAGFDRNSQTQLQYNIRTFPSMLSGVRGKGFNTLSMSVHKTVTLREKIHVVIYGNMEDVTNNQPWATPNTSPTSSLFGQVSSLHVDTVGRRSTLGVRVKW